MQNKIQIKCPKCGKSKVEIPFTRGHQVELVDRIEYLEQRLFSLVEENKDLRLLIQRL